jgi:hypothetical protein
VGFVAVSLDTCSRMDFYEIQAARIYIYKRIRRLNIVDTPEGR